MESVRLTFVAPADALPGDYIRVFSDNGSGAIDFDNPIGGLVPILPKGSACAIRGRETRGRQTRKNNYTSSGGRGCEIRGQQTRGQTRALVVWRGGLFYGPHNASKTFQFAGAVYDKLHVASGGSKSATTILINTSPRGPVGLTASTLSAGVLTFTFTASPDLA